MTPAAIKIPNASGEPLASPRSPNRKFSIYASRRRDDDDSPVPAAYESPLPSPSYPHPQTISLPPSPKVQIVPFGFAYRDSSESLQLSQLPPLPLSPLPPMSPRWDSLSHSSKFVLQPAPSSPYPASPMDPPPHPPSPFAYDAYSIPSDSRNASPTFPLVTKSSLGDLRASDSPSASAPADSFNFSRPRKQSIRQPITDPATPRPTLSFNPADQYLELVSSPTQTPLWPPTRPRGPSVSSCQSSSTYHSVLSPPASELHEPRQPRSRPTTNGAAPSPRPPLSNINTGGPASPNAVVAPWMSGEELRSSFRSQFTESTAPGTTATERSSVLTKDSSVTSLYPLADADIEDDGLGEADGDDDELSLDDLMGMYEKGFDDDEASDIDYHVPDRPDTSASHVDYNLGLRPDTAASDIDYHIGARAASSTSDRDYNAGAHPASLVPDHDYNNIGGESRTSVSGAEYDVSARPITLTSDVGHSVDARPVTSTSHRDYHDSRPPSSTSDRDYQDTRPTSSTSTRDYNMGSPLTTLASDREPSHSFIQIQIDNDDDDDDFPRRGANSAEKNLDAEIRMSKMIFTEWMSLSMIVLYDIAAILLSDTPGLQNAHVVIACPVNYTSAWGLGVDETMQLLDASRELPAEDRPLEEQWCTEQHMSVALEPRQFRMLRRSRVEPDVLYNRVHISHALWGCDGPGWVGSWYGRAVERGDAWDEGRLLRRFEEPTSTQSP